MALTAQLDIGLGNPRVSGPEPGTCPVGTIMALMVQCVVERLDTHREVRICRPNVVFTWPVGRGERWIRWLRLTQGRQRYGELGVGLTIVVLLESECNLDDCCVNMQVN